MHDDDFLDIKKYIQYNKIMFFHNFSYDYYYFPSKKGKMLYFYVQKRKQEKKFKLKKNLKIN